MTTPRREIVSLSDTTFYHCISRCVRRAFLCGQDHYSGQSYEHRRDWLQQKLLLTADIFAIKLCSFAVMSNHYHVVLNVRTDIASSWEEREVIERWHRLFAGSNLSTRYLQGEFLTPSENLQLKRTISLWRKRLTDISWFMRIVNEAIARRANEEDKCTGRFWEGRFKSYALLDQTALIACMAYVDLNPIRSKISSDPLLSDFTSIRLRFNALNRGEQSASQLEQFVGNQPGKIGIPFKLKEYIALLDSTANVSNKEICEPHIKKQMKALLKQLQIRTENWLNISTKFESHRFLKVSLHSIHRCTAFDIFTPP